MAKDYIDRIAGEGYRYMKGKRQKRRVTLGDMKTIEEINKAIIGIQPNEGQVSDGYHTFDELYDFRRAYNAALVNTHKYPCIKSYRHSDGELCFGGGWFVVQMQLPTGQISNHYENKYWDEFDCEVRERADEWDGHTDKDVLERLTNLNRTDKHKISIPIPEDAKWEAIGRGYASVLMEKQARIDRLEQLILMTYQNVCQGMNAAVIDEDDLYQDFCTDIVNKFKKLKEKETEK